MTTQTFESYEKYRLDLAAFRESQNHVPTWLRDLRDAGSAAFCEMGFPTATRGNERWKYTNVRPIANQVFGYPFGAASNGAMPALPDLDRRLEAVAPLDADQARLVFVDGRPDANNSAPANGTLAAMDLRSAVESRPDVVRENLAQLARPDEDGFTAVNTAFLGDGAFVHVPDDATGEPIVHLVYVSTERSDPVATHPRTLVVVGRNAELTLIESYVALGAGSYFTNAVTEIVGHDGAKIEHYRYMMESPDAFHVGATRVSLHSDASFTSTSLARGAKVARNDVSVVLDSPGSECTLRGLYITSGSEHIDNHIDVDHATPYTTSAQYYKGVLDGRSKAVFSGRVLIRRAAQKSNAAQKDLNLMLSDGARVNTKPSMEIFADDVKAVHGATAGAIAEDALFYMRSRGVDEEAARALLVQGFANEIIEPIGPPALRRHVEAVFAGKLLAEGGASDG